MSVYLYALLFILGTSEWGITGAQAEPTVVQVTTILSPPFMMKRAESTDGEDFYEGYIYDVLKLLEIDLGVVFNISLVKDGRYGSIYPNGTWSGMIGELVRNEADVAAADLTITSMRERVVDFTKPFMSTTLRILAKKLDRISAPGLTLLFQPVSAEAWVAIAVASILIFVLLCVISRLNTKPSDVEQKSGALKILSCGDNCGILLSLSGRILVIFSVIGAVSICMLYMADLTSFILAGGHAQTSQRLPFNNVEDLAKQTNIEYGVVNHGSTMAFFKMSKVAVYERMWRYMASNPANMVGSAQEGMERVTSSQGQYAFMAESPLVEYAADSNCDLTAVGGGFGNVRGYGLAVHIGYRLKAELNVGILQLQETGDLNLLYNKWFTGHCKQTPSVDDSEIISSTGRYVVALEFKSFSLPLLLLLIGVIASIVVLVIEQLTSRRKQ